MYAIRNICVDRYCYVIVAIIIIYGPDEMRNCTHENLCTWVCMSPFNCSLDVYSDRIFVKYFFVLDFYVRFLLSRKSKLTSAE